MSAQTVGPKDLKRKAARKEASEAKADAPSSVSQSFEKEGVRVDFTVQALASEKGQGGKLIAGADAAATFRVTDARTGQPITGLHPNAWISSRPSDSDGSEAECKDKIRSFMGGLLSVRADIDLNSYYALTLNHDNTISIINPQVAFSRTKLESIIPLPGRGVDWALSKNRDFLYVTLPEQSLVVVVSTVSRKIVNTIPTGEKTRPTRIALDPDERLVWVGLDGSPQVAVIDTANNKLVRSVAVGEGLHNFAFTADGRFAYVTNSASDTVSAIDAQTLTKVADIPVGKTPVPIAYSAAGRHIYAASINGASVSVIDPARQQVTATIPVKRGVVALRFEPEGRYGFAVNQIEDAVFVIDAATNSIVGSSKVVKGPDQVSFTRRYAYVRGTGSEKFSLIELNEVARGKVAPVDIQAGQKPPSALPADIGVSDMIAPTPEGNAAVIANAPDMMLYYYVEGMMAPVGTLSNYKRRPHALMLLDRSLSEIAPGVYSSPIRLKNAGRFDVPLLIGQPRFVNCFQLDVADSPESEKQRKGASVAVEALFKGGQFKPGEAVRLRFKLTDPETGKPIEGLESVRVLVFEPPGLWQERQWARAVDAGTYEVTQVFPHAGLYHVLIGIASHGINPGDLPFTAVSVVEAQKGSK
ncbi:MAG TPA: YncE family protein [Pyrinomonadaceae bacterium]